MERLGDLGSLEQGRIIHFYGAMFCEGAVWICMEVMDMRVDKFYVHVFKNGHSVLRQGVVMPFF